MIWIIGYEIYWQVRSTVTHFQITLPSGLFSIKPMPSKTLVMSYIRRFCTCSFLPPVANWWMVDWLVRGSGVCPCAVAKQADALTLRRCSGRWLRPQTGLVQQIFSSTLPVNLNIAVHDRTGEWGPNNQPCRSAPRRQWPGKAWNIFFLGGGWGGYLFLFCRCSSRGFLFFIRMCQCINQYVRR